MKIYLAHSTKFDFQNDLYGPIKKSEAYGIHMFVLPHDKAEWKNSREIIKNSDLVIAEVTYPSTGLGIELGWANAYDIPIICIYREGGELSKSLKAIASKERKYNTENIGQILKDITSKF